MMQEQDLCEVGVKKINETKVIVTILLPRSASDKDTTGTDPTRAVKYNYISAEPELHASTYTRSSGENPPKD